MPIANAQVEEITVSAQRRDASLQEVPISVTALSFEDTQKLGIDMSMDIGAAVPNMQTYTVTSNAAAMQVFMRGAGIQNPGFVASESPVGIYVDNIYRGRMATANLDLADIERIEVLRGPQGTLYGRNTIAGAVKVITRTPADEFWADGSVGYGNFETAKITASVGGPIVDGLGASFAALYHDRGEGWIERGSTGGRDLGEYTNQAFRGKLNWFGSDVFGATLSVAYVDAENDGYNGIPYGSANNDQAPKPDFNPAASPGVPLEGFYDSLVPDSTAGKGETEQFNSSLELSLALGGVTIRSITGYSDIDDLFNFDLSGGAFQCYDDPDNAFDGPCFDLGGNPVEQGPIFTGNPGVLIRSNSNNKTITQEFTVEGSGFRGSLDWIAGIFYMNEEGEQAYNPSVPFAGDEIIESVTTDTDSYAIFAEGTLHFTDKLSATLGARWTRDEKKYTNDCTIVQAGAFPTCVTTGFAFADWSLDLDEDFDEFTPRLLVQYQATDNVMLFGSYSSGFQAGGFQTLCFGFQDCASATYKPQTVDSWEAGAKTDFLDKTLRVNAAVFYADYSDVQQTSISGAAVVFPVLNVGEASVTGVELEVNWSPTEAFNAFLIAGYANDDISSKAQAQLPPSNQGRLPGLPEITARVGADWRAGIFGNWDFLVGGDVNYVDDYYATINNALLIDSYTRLNGRIGIDQPDGNWSVILQGKNLTDEEDNVSGISGAGTNIRTPLPPREYMLMVNYRYGG
ncbi:MAG: TonB-dependent receptor [Gammaproteobacteria bacterium]